MNFKSTLSIIFLLYISVLYGFYKSYDDLIECKVFFFIQANDVDEDFFQSHIRAGIAQKFSKYVKSDKKRVFQNVDGNKADFIIQYQLYSDNANPSFFEKLLWSEIEELRAQDHINLYSARVGCENPIKIFEKIIFVFLITILFFLLAYKVNKKLNGSLSDV